MASSRPIGCWIALSAFFLASAGCGDGSAPPDPPRTRPDGGIREDPADAAGADADATSLGLDASSRDVEVLGDGGFTDGGYADLGMVDAASDDGGHSDADVLPDAGGVEDSGPMDVSGQDAGSIDSGPPEDGGPNDAGFSDAGESDGSVVDAAGLDATLLDASPEDGGPLDAGGPDAASPLDASGLDAALTDLASGDIGTGDLGTGDAGAVTLSVTGDGLAPINVWIGFNPMVSCPSGTCTWSIPVGTPVSIDAQGPPRHFPIYNWSPQAAGSCGSGVGGTGQGFVLCALTVSAPTFVTIRWNRLP